MLKEHAQALDTDPADVARTRISSAAEAAFVAAGAGEPHALAATLTASIGLASAERTQRSAHEVRAETHLAWRAFFSALATTAPTVVLVEDCTGPTSRCSSCSRTSPVMPQARSSCCAPRGPS